MHNHWHIYSQEQLKPAVTGDRVYVLAAAEAPEVAFRTFVGRNVRHHPIIELPEGQQESSVLNYPYGIIFEGVSQKAIDALLLPEVPAHSTGSDVRFYNKQAVANAKKLFLAECPVPKGIDALSFCLVQGLVHMVPTFKALSGIPITSLKRPTDNRGILVVEDDEAQLELFQVLLESLGYKNVLLAQDGNQALSILGAMGGEIDLILLNWQMPGMDGISLLRELGRGYRHMVGVIMESGYPHNEYIREFFNLGTSSVVAIDYLVKPFRLDELALEVRVAMEFMRRRKLRSW